jgi:uncharacterized repeat protein (TIGR02543 family)
MRKKLVRLGAGLVSLLLFVALTGCPPEPEGETQYTLAFSADGGTTVLTVADGRTVSVLPTPTRSGYTFGGWLRHKTVRERSSPQQQKLTATPG